MSVEENKAAFRRIPEEVINSGNLDLADEVFAPDYVDHAPVPPIPQDVGLKVRCRTEAISYF